MSSDPEVDTIARLLQLAARYRLEELDVEEGGLRIRLLAADHTGELDLEAGEANGSGILWRPPAWPDAGGPAERGALAPTVTVTAPLTGTFYRASNPEHPPLAEVGDTVEEGQPVGIIEAMKVFSEVLADRAGVVTQFVVKNGQVVEQGDAILHLDPEAGSDGVME